MRKKKERQQREAAAEPARKLDWIPFVEKHSPWLALILVAVATFRIVATYDIFNHTVDEPAHVASGIEYLAKNQYTLEPHHPPLGRLAVALWPFLDGRRPYGRQDYIAEGVLILYDGAQYDQTLAHARTGVLPFFWIACAVVFLGGLYLGRLPALLALLIFTTTPLVLAHSGLATNDTAGTAFTGACVLSWIWCARKPGAARGAVAGVMSALALLSKFSSLLFVPAALAVILAAWIWRSKPPVGAFLRSMLLPLAVAIPVGLLVVWAGYGFSMGPVAFLENRELPAPALWQGIHDLVKHNDEGHPAYLLGEWGRKGWWYFFPVLIVFKTPVAFLMLLAIGAAIAWRQPRALLPLAGALAIVAVSMPSRINIGLRHVMPAYIGFALVAGVAAAEWLRRDRARRWSAAALLAWLVLSVGVSHPDYLPYFNFLAGDEPERIAVDSDLDWGQDMKRLSKRLRELGAEQVTFNPFTRAYLEAAHGFPKIHETDPLQPSPGWNAVSLTVWKVARFGLFHEHREIVLWPERAKPNERVGKGVLLYYVPPPR